MKHSPTLKFFSLLFLATAGLLVVLSNPIAGLAAAPHSAADLAIYSDVLSSGWEDWSWDTSEYNWGGLEAIKGALAQADVLGIFGREGLDLATLWSPPTINQPGMFAFRMYRNYDGQGSAFGETSLQAASADQDKLAVYAAERTSDERIDPDGDQ